jgi:hypothetical protein
MKNTYKIWLAGVIFTSSAMAIDLGSLDTSFSNDGNSDGWDISGEMGYDRYGSDVIIDSQGRILIAGTYDYDFNGNDFTGARLERRLPNGQLDNSFDGDGIKELTFVPASQGQFEYQLQLDSVDGVFLGYSRLYCVTDNDCESDLYIYHINANGFVVGVQKIEFDLGSTIDRHDDVFADMVYIPSLNKLAITAEVELDSPNDTDYGIALLNVDPVSGALSIDTGFSVDGMRQCYFDQNGSSGSQDKPEAIVWDSLTNHLIVGGSTFEGNGFGGDGWNMSFCEFDMVGNLISQWSTMSNPDTLDDREFLKDMAFRNINGTSHLIIAAALPGAGGLDFAVTKYSLNQFLQWETDSNFGSLGNGWESTAFQYIFVGDTNDIPNEMVIEEDNSILLAGTISWTDNNMLPHGAIALARYTPNGRLDSNWGIGHSGKAVHSFDVSNKWDSAESVAIDPVTEEIYVTGWSYDGLDFQSLIANMHNDLVFANNFDF